MAQLQDKPSSIALIFGSDTGMTEEVTETIQEKWSSSRWSSIELEVMEVSSVKVEDFDRFDKFIFGLSTWYDGDLQSDWETFYDEGFKDIDFTDKQVAIFGLGDFVLYAEFFVDGVGILAKQVLKAGGTVVGHWSNTEYDYEASVAEIEGEDMFYGLALDELNEPDRTDDRLDTWLEQVMDEFGV